MANDKVDLSFMTEENLETWSDETIDQTSIGETQEEQNEELDEQENDEQENDEQDDEDENEDEDLTVPAEKYEKLLAETEKAKAQAEKRKSRAKKWKSKAKKVVDTKNDIREEFEMYKQEQKFIKHNPDAEDFIDDVREIAIEKSLNIEDAYALYSYKNNKWKKVSKDWVHGWYKKHKPKAENDNIRNFFDNKIEKNLKIKLK